MSEPEMHYVDSSNVEQVGYDPDARELWVRFLNNRTYVYSDVDELTHRELVNAPSVGSYLNRVIRNSFEYREV